MSARASSSRRRMPPESFGARTPAFARRSKTSIISRARVRASRAAHPEVAAVVAQRLLDVEEAVEVDVLLGEPDHAPRRERVVRLAEDLDLAGRHADDVADGADERRLARAVGPEQAEEAALRDLEVEVLEREEAAVPGAGPPAAEPAPVGAGIVVELREAADAQRGGTRPGYPGPSVAIWKDARHAPCPHSRPAHRARRARVRHLLAPAQRAHHLPRHRRRRQVANLIVAQLLHLESSDPDKDISLYINSPGGSITAGLAIYDTMNFIKPDVSTMCMGIAMSMGSLLLDGGRQGQALLAAQQPDPHPPAVGRLRGPVDGHRDPGARDPQDAQADGRDLRASTPAARRRKCTATWSATASSSRTRPSSTASSTASSTRTRHAPRPDPRRAGAGPRLAPRSRPRRRSGRVRASRLSHLTVHGLPDDGA